MAQQRTCKYGCNTTLGEFDTAENKFRELDGTLHTKSRCESLKPKQVPNDRNGNDLSVEVLLRKLETVGVKIDLAKLRLVNK